MIKSSFLSQEHSSLFPFLLSYFLFPSLYLILFLSPHSHLSLFAIYSSSISPSLSYILSFSSSQEILPVREYQSTWSMQCCNQKVVNDQSTGFYEVSKTGKKRFIPFFLCVLRHSTAHSITLHACAIGGYGDFPPIHCSIELNTKSSFLYFNLRFLFQIWLYLRGWCFFYDISRDD